MVPARELGSLGESRVGLEGARRSPHPWMQQPQARGSQKPLTETKERASGCWGGVESPLGFLGFGCPGALFFRPQKPYHTRFSCGLACVPRLCVTGVRPLDSRWFLGLGKEAVVSRGTGSLEIPGRWLRGRLNQRWQSNLPHMPSTSTFHLPASGAPCAPFQST